ncbi:hypothetical protein HQ520_09945 [bacterium]|nr:hypothetical protein [bacterium]
MTIGLEAEDFQFSGGWQLDMGQSGYSGSGYLFAGMEGGARLPALTAVEIPRAGTYYLWARALDFATDRPGIRKMTATVNGEKADDPFGNHGKSGWGWERGGSFDLPVGRVPVTIEDVDKFWGRIDAIVLTTDPDLEPTGVLDTPGLPRTELVRVDVKQESGIGFAGPYDSDPLAARPATLTGGAASASLENENVRIEFMPAERNGEMTVVPRISVNRDGTWEEVAADTASEAYVVTATDKIELTYSAGVPWWSREGLQEIMVEMGGKKIQTALQSRRPEIWWGGSPYRFQPAKAKQTRDGVEISFAKLPVGRLTALWSLKPGEKAARVRLSLKVAKDGIYSLGYHLPFSRTLDQVEEIQLPLMWQRKRLPEKAYCLLDPRTPTPFSLAQTGTGDESLAWAVIGDPSEIPFGWPDDRFPNMGFAIRDEAGNVRPAIYGPVAGKEEANFEKGDTVAFRFRVLFQAGDWYAGFRTAADEAFNFHDYRKNRNVSLTDAAFNMIELMMDDEFGGWWRRAKGWYQIESKNGASQSAPVTLVSIYNLTGDEQIYERRARPTMEYILSRNGAHFSPEPEDTGRYDIGGMVGPASLYGTTAYGAMYEMTHGFTPAFRELALPEEGIDETVGYSHAGVFNEWAARYRLTNDPEDMKKAMEAADKYLEDQIYTASTVPVGYSPFWLISFVPDWEGLLLMYEMTGEKRYLEGSAFGARQLMTGLWTQPNFPEGDTVIFKDGEFEADPWSFGLTDRGPYRFRLGYPIAEKGLKEHLAPAWAVSVAGLGFEQPSTLGYKYNRIIFQAVWAPEFLRLARYTGEKAFETHARNATVGRFANYPGYYIGGHHDLMQYPEYNYYGPDLTVIYYHHILPHLSWTIDYLVSEAEYLSDGAVTFPFQRENGYAYFDGRIYGHAPGKVMGAEDCWLWFNRGAVILNNEQVNHLTAYNKDQFFTILMNQDVEPTTTSLYFSPQAIGFDPEEVKTVTVVSKDGEEELEIGEGMVNVALPARGLAVVRLDGANVNVPIHRMPAKPEPGAQPSYVRSGEGEVYAKAAAIQMLPGKWDAYIWCTSDYYQAQKVNLEYKIADGDWTTIEDTEYPYEFTIPVDDPAKTVTFRMQGEDREGGTFSIPEAILGAVRAR